MFLHKGRDKSMNTSHYVLKTWDEEVVMRSLDMVASMYSLSKDLAQKSSVRKLLSSN